MPVAVLQYFNTFNVYKQFCAVAMNAFSYFSEVGLSPFKEKALYAII